MSRILNLGSSVLTAVAAMAFLIGAATMDRSAQASPISYQVKCVSDDGCYAGCPAGTTCHFTGTCPCY